MRDPQQRRILLSIDAGLIIVEEMTMDPLYIFPL